MTCFGECSWLKLFHHMPLIESALVFYFVVDVIVTPCTVQSLVILAMVNRNVCMRANGRRLGMA